MKNVIYQNYPWLLIALLIIFPYFLAEPEVSQLEFKRQAIFDGQLYRLITAHFVHTNLYHLLLNLGGLVVIGLVSTLQLAHKDWWVGLLVSSVTVSCGLVLFNPELEWYRGMSGVLHGLTVILILKTKMLAGFIRGLILILLAVKLVLEQMHIGLWQSEQLIGAPVVVDAHLYGVIGGLISYIVLQQTRSKMMFRDKF